MSIIRNFPKCLGPHAIRVFEAPGLGLRVNLCLIQSVDSKTSFHISVLMKQGQRFRVVGQSEMNATRNCFAALICINIRTHTVGTKIFVERWRESSLICVWINTVWPKFICYYSLFWKFFVVVFIKKTSNFIPSWFSLEKCCCKSCIFHKPFLPKFASTRKVRLTLPWSICACTCSDARRSARDAEMQHVIGTKIQYSYSGMLHWITLD